MPVKKNLNEEPKEKKLKWNVKILIESDKAANLIAREENFPLPDENFDDYPVCLLIQEQFTFWGMMKKVIQFSKMGIYSVVYKDPK